MSKPALVSIVVPVYNESEGLPILMRALSSLDTNHWGDRFEFILVDDGSSDDTWNRLQAWGEEEPRLTAIRLAGNSGAHRASRAGLAHASGDAMIVLPADLQEGTDLMDACLEKWHENGKMVVMMVPAASRPYEHRHEAIAARLFYSLLRFSSRIHHDAPVTAVAKLMDRVAVRSYLKDSSPFGLRTPYMLRQRFSMDLVSYSVHERAYGSSKWSLQKKLALTLDMLVESSSWLLSPWPMALAGGCTYAAFQILAVSGAPGGRFFATAAAIVLSATLLIILSVLGMHVARIYQRLLGGPAYVIRELRRGMPQREWTEANDSQEENPQPVKEFGGHTDSLLSRSRR